MGANKMQPATRIRVLSLRVIDPTSTVGKNWKGREIIRAGSHQRFKKFII
jgi:hypothetical protein